jgi:alpha-D-xyloside xylohydrolase
MFKTLLTLNAKIKQSIALFILLAGAMATLPQTLPLNPLKKEPMALPFR